MSNREKEIYSECKLQTRIISVLLNKMPAHQSGKDNVCKKLNNTKGAIGLIDEDPQAPPSPYLKKANLKEEKEGLKLYIDNNGNKLIVVCPNLETWFLNILKEEKINLKGYGFSKDIDEITPNFFEIEIRSNLSNFQRLLHGLMEKDNKKLITLKKFLEE